ncbi:hypothetical protein G3U99_13440 [Vibrio coralliilyticus OCN008]|uniref:hypothetical protein n=1 Tax=Vibrio coralliilyticus TaxID=190893 RepID=UPI0013F4AACF|nr:hypothetical protein [Vibrio coralliilyticus]QIJ84740.1 hypothetical protein G3U99_10975 [Vibrio coralliilyticus OCN008]QIJ85202.1 hypothetical protein G3U99_13440 [Vibrio coralliilyticus OCN008]
MPSTLLLALESTGQDSPMTLLDEQVAQDGRVSHHSGGAEHTRLTYDAFGHLLSSDTLVGNLQTGELKPVSSATQVYDGLGRVISETNAQGVTTTTQYLDARRQVLVTQVGGATVTRTYSTAGQLVSEIQEAPEQPQRERQFVYNEAGQLVATQHPDGENASSSMTLKASCGWRCLKRGRSQSIAETHKDVWRWRRSTPVRLTPQAG